MIEGDQNNCSEQEQLHTTEHQMPDTLPPVMGPEWQRVVADLKERKLFKESMIGVIAAYITALWTVSEAQKAIGTHGAFVTGAGGALKPNPATGLLCRSQDTAARLAGELGLTPTSRARKSLQPSNGQTSLFNDEFDL